MSFSSKNSLATRDPLVPLVLRRNELLVVGDRTRAIRVADVEIALVLLERLVQPTRIRSLTLKEKELFDHLLSAGAIATSLRPKFIRSVSLKRSRATSTELKRWKGRAKIVVAVTGAIQACVFPILLYRSLLPFARSVDVILTKAARNFVTSKSIQALGARVWTNVFANETTAVPHIELAKADLILVYPASASTIHRLASGMCSDLLSLTVAATGAPILLVPAMNGKMLKYPPIRRNIRQLIDDGAYVVIPSLMHEVSAGVGSNPIYGGAGVSAERLSDTMGSVLSHSKNSAE